MIGWLKNANGIEKKKIEPGATFSVLEDHWKQITQVMESSQDADGAEAVISHMGQMISFLRMARIDSENTCKVFWLQHKCSDSVIKWLHHLQVQGVQFPSEVESKLVTMLHSLCEVASKDGELLGYVKETDNVGSSDENEGWDGAYSLASLLLEYSLRNEGSLGETARYCFILLIQLAAKYSRLEKNLTEGAGRGLTNVVISGLSACFSTLPTFTQSSREQLRAFTIQLRFVDEVCKASSSSVASTIADCFMNAFLLSVIQPAMTQDQGNSRLHNHQDPFVTSLFEEIAMVTYYFQIVCEQLTNPYLIRSVIMFTNSALLPILIQRICHPNVAVVASTLRLFNVLFDFYCEDFWYHSILRHLVPENHLMVSQRNIQLREIDFHESSVRLLSLIPGNVVDSIGSELLTSHYLKYLSSESERFMSTVLMVKTNTTTISSYTASMSDQDEDETKQSNVIYPLWKYKYDGTDGNVLTGPSSSTSNMKSTEQLNQEPSSSVSDSNTNTNHSNYDPLSSNHVHGEELMTISIDESPDGDTDISVKLPSELPSIERLSAITINDKCGENYDRNDSPVSSDGLPSHKIASLGDFLDNVFVQLSNWPYLDLEVILVLTELVSTIAASRLPLITSLLLDPNLTLQPYYVTFTSLLQRIRNDLEYHLKTCPPYILTETWNKVDETSGDTRRRSSGSSQNLSLSTYRSTPPSTANADNLGESIIKGTTLISSAMRSFFGRKPSASTASPPPTTNNTNNNSPIVRLVGTQETRYTVRPQNQNDDAKKQMALRAIYFSHWMFELAAISQQLSWKSI